ncbi:CBS domain-containing protein [Streptoalloteichus tenebrarius]|uniref:CBS domain-containing protein n=1 Tax=Streptoalloteichus tenebrarius (strain ATCC 17920 / DSM 40477 / JCM 4838 / CBS 697.72 / NBRC 16177 / NCIMB 11028 / NRRL B-12390 / A12253. 1 / ISP 5477) TaxID=1933 RepID=A0ABT1HZR1_STRSD|nr:CBS domain-containing protein [Streptoalloteichus tenebrarius]MCP2260985.1 CBS domain-containing protein [Streptoalloteichus tenebrarius]BFE98924.1 CBS domain-containing protein [Streptoalloteichus tenebrarius]
MRAKDVMTHPAVTVGPETPVKTAAAMLAEHGFTALPVVDEDERLVGIVTEADVMRGRIPRDPRSRLYREAPPPASPPATVGEVMTTTVTAMPPGADLADIATVMLEKNIRSVPVVEGSRVVGVVTRRDLVRVLAREDTVIAADVRHRLEIYGGLGRWTVRVEHGVVTVEDEFDDPTDQQVARTLALAVPGAQDVRTLVRRKEEWG